MMPGDPNESALSDDLLAKLAVDPGLERYTTGPGQQGNTVIQDYDEADHIVSVNDPLRFFAGDSGQAGKSPTTNEGIEPDAPTTSLGETKNESSSEDEEKESSSSDEAAPPALPFQSEEAQRKTAEPEDLILGIGKILNKFTSDDTILSSGPEIMKSFMTPTKDTTKKAQTGSSNKPRLQPKISTEIIGKQSNGSRTPANKTQGKVESENKTPIKTEKKLETHIKVGNVLDEKSEPSEVDSVSAVQNKTEVMVKNYQKEKITESPDANEYQPMDESLISDDSEFDPDVTQHSNFNKMEKYFHVPDQPANHTSIKTENSTKAQVEPEINDLSMINTVESDLDPEGFRAVVVKNKSPSKLGNINPADDPDDPLYGSGIQPEEKDQRKREEMQPLRPTSDSRSPSFPNQDYNQGLAEQKEDSRPVEGLARELLKKIDKLQIELEQEREQEGYFEELKPTISSLGNTNSQTVPKTNKTQTREEHQKTIETVKSFYFGSSSQASTAVAINTNNNKGGNNQVILRPHDAFNTKLSVPLNSELGPPTSPHKGDYREPHSPGNLASEPAQAGSSGEQENLLSNGLERQNFSSSSATTATNNININKQRPQEVFNKDVMSNASQVRSSTTFYSEHDYENVYENLTQWGQYGYFTSENTKSEILNVVRSAQDGVGFRGIFGLSKCNNSDEDPLFSTDSSTLNQGLHDFFNRALANAYSIDKRLEQVFPKILFGTIIVPHVIESLVEFDDFVDSISADALEARLRTLGLCLLRLLQDITLSEENEVGRFIIQEIEEIVETCFFHSNNVRNMSDQNPLHRKGRIPRVQSFLNEGHDALKKRLIKEGRLLSDTYDERIKLAIISFVGLGLDMPSLLRLIIMSNSYWVDGSPSIQGVGESLPTRNKRASKNQKPDTEEKKEEDNSNQELLQKSDDQKAEEEKKDSSSSSSNIKTEKEKPKDDQSKRPSIDTTGLMGKKTLLFGQSGTERKIGLHAGIEDKNISIIGFQETITLIKPIADSDSDSLIELGTAAIEKIKKCTPGSKKFTALYNIIAYCRLAHQLQKNGTNMETTKVAISKLDNIQFPLGCIGKVLFTGIVKNFSVKLEDFKSKDSQKAFLEAIKDLPSVEAGSKVPKPSVTQDRARSTRRKKSTKKSTKSPSSTGRQTLEKWTDFDTQSQEDQDYQDYPPPSYNNNKGGRPSKGKGKKPSSKGTSSRENDSQITKGLVRDVISGLNTAGYQVAPNWSNNTKGSSGKYNQEAPNWSNNAKGASSVYNQSGNVNDPYYHTNFNYGASKGNW